MVIRSLRPGLLGALVLVAATCSSSDSAPTPVDSRRPDSTAPAAPPSPPPTEDVGVLELSLEVDDAGVGLVTTQLVNHQSAGDLSDTRMRVLQRWDGTDWEDVALLPYRSQMTSPAPACPPDAFEDCAADANDPPDVSPGEQGDPRMFTVPDVTPGLYRMIERPYGQGAVSEHVELSES